MYIYILRCDDNSLYTGIARDMIKRIRQHTGVIKGGAKYTRSHKVKRVEVVLQIPDKNARRLECAIKKLPHKKKENIVSDPDNIRLLCGNMDFECCNTEKYNILLTEILHYGNSD